MSNPATDPPWMHEMDRLLMCARAMIDRRWQRRIAASDIVQQTMIDADRSGQELSKMSREERWRWLLTALRRNLIDAVRHHTRGRRDVRLDQSFDDRLENSTRRVVDLLTSAQPSGGSEEQAQRLQRVLDVLTSLDPIQRDSIRLRYLEGLSIDEIAAELNQPRTVIVRALDNGMRALRRRLNEETG